MKYILSIQDLPMWRLPKKDQHLLFHPTRRYLLSNNQSRAHLKNHTHVCLPNLNWKFQDLTALTLRVGPSKKNNFSNPTKHPTNRELPLLLLIWTAYHVLIPTDATNNLITSWKIFYILSKLGLVTPNLMTSGSPSQVNTTNYGC